MLDQLYGANWFVYGKCTTGSLTHLLGKLPLSRGYFFVEDMRSSGSYEALHGPTLLAVTFPITGPGGLELSAFTVRLNFYGGSHRFYIYISCADLRFDRGTVRNALELANGAPEKKNKSNRGKEKKNVAG